MKANGFTREILARIRDHELVEEWEVGNLITAGYVKETGSYCDPYELTPEGHEALKT